MICLPVIETNIEDALETAKRYLEIADLVEFRIDMLRKGSEEDLMKKD